MYTETFRSGYSDILWLVHRRFYRAQLQTTATLSIPYKFTKRSFVTNLLCTKKSLPKRKGFCETFCETISSSGFRPRGEHPIHFRKFSSALGYRPASAHPSEQHKLRFQPSALHCYACSRQGTKHCHPSCNLH